MTLEVLPLDPIGAEIRGLALGASLSEENFALLRGTLLAHGLVLMRDQALGDEEQVALGHRFGPLESISLGPNDPNIRELIEISNLDAEGCVHRDASETMRSMAINEQWHTDSSFREAPATYSIFRAVVVPPEGGETWFASLRRGWEALDPETQASLEGLRAVHDYREAYRKAGAQAAFEGMGFVLEGLQPLIRRHPETGARGLYVTGHATHVEGMERAEGRALIEELIDFCTQEGRVYRHAWRPNDVMIWDNRCMLHRAQGFDQRHTRVMHHVRVAGTEPVIS